MSQLFILRSAAAMLMVASCFGCHHRYVYNGGCGGGCFDTGVCSPSCASPKGVPCAKGCGGKGCSGGFGILSALYGHTWHGCGCGELYIHEWLSDPPDCCDPCDSCYGAYVGPQQNCPRICVDPLLWQWAHFGKHCRCDRAWCDPCNGSCATCDCQGGCGCGGSCKGGKCDGGVILDAPPMLEQGSGDVYEIPQPVLQSAGAANDRVAAQPAPSEVRRARFVR